MTPVHPKDLLRTVQADIRRNILRAENGIKHVAAIDRAATAQTPKDVVWRRDNVTVWRYRNDDIRHSPPVFIIASLVSRAYVLDLRPGHSLIEWLRDSHFDVYMIDFGDPDAADAHNTLETYVDRYLRPALRAAAGSGEITVFGYCLGGLLGLMTVAADPGLPVRNLVCLATPVDFQKLEDGIFEYIRRGRVKIDDIVDDSGNIPGPVMRNFFRLRKPTADIAQHVALLERLWDSEYVDGFQAISKWAADSVAFPGALGQQMSDVLLRKNAVAYNELRLGDKRIDFCDVTCPILSVIAADDDLVPSASSAPLLDLVGSPDKTLLELPGGHMGLILGRRAVTRTLPALKEWLADHGEPAGGNV